MKTYWKSLAIALQIGFVVCMTTGSTVHAASLNLPFSPEQNQGVFLLISDLHFSPFASSDIVKQLNTAPLDDWKAILDTSKKVAFAGYGKDTNYPLLISTIETAGSVNIDYDFILFPGDYIAHNFKALYQQQVGGSATQYATFVENSMRFVKKYLHQTFPKAPLISALGNNDSLCGDYKIAPNSPLLRKLAPAGGINSGSSKACRSFSVGGFYTVPHPTILNREIIVLNNIFWSYKYQDACNANGGDPGQVQIAWLEWVLYRLKQEGKTATILMHVPPGVNSYVTAKMAVPGQPDCKEHIHKFWADKYARSFLKLVRKYHEILANGFVGHTHMDDFRTVFDANDQPFLFMRISPAVSPVFGNNPAFTLVLYDKITGKLIDYAVYSLTNLTQAGSSEAARWTMEYSFGAAYGLSEVTPASMDILANEIEKDSNIRQKYEKYYAVETQSDIDTNIKAYQCAQTAINVEDYAACYCKQDSAIPEKSWLESLFSSQ